MNIFLYFSKITRIYFTRFTFSVPSQEYSNMFLHPTSFQSYTKLHGRYLINNLCIPFVHPVVDDGVDTGVGHCQPVEEQVYTPDPRLSEQDIKLNVSTASLKRDHQLCDQR